MDNLSRSLLNTFVVDGIDHVSTRRNDADWIDAQFNSECLIFLLWRGSVLVEYVAETDSAQPPQYKLVEFSTGQVQEIDGVGQPLFLGQIVDTNRKPVFAAIVNNERDGVDDAFADAGQFIDLRKAGAGLDAQAATLVAQAKAIGEWHDRHRFCPRCGSGLKAVSAGHVLRCQSGDCGRDHFPRLDPAIIVRVNIDERILLGRQAVWAPHQYSVIAGFSEPGESLEQSVAREVFEETGIEVSEVHYQSSQPWPFPSNMMLGYAAIAAHDQIEPNDDELEDAQWFTRADMVSRLESKTLRVPPALSISFRLIEDWFDQGEFGKLADVVKRTGTQWVPPPVTS